MNRGLAFLASVAAAATTMQVSFDLAAGTGWLSIEALPVLAVQRFIAFVLIAFASLFPALAATVMLDRVHSWRLSICVGAANITAGLFTVLGATYMTQADGDPEQLTFAQAVPRYCCWTLPAGLAGGLSFWACAFRPIAREKSE